MEELKKLSLADLKILQERADRKYQQHQINKERGERLEEIGEELAESCRKLGWACHEEIQNRLQYYVGLFH